MKFNRTTCRHLPSKKGLSPVLIRVTYNGKRLNIYTGISCDENRWDKKRNCLKQGSKINGFEYNVLNEQIRQQEAFIDDYFNMYGYATHKVKVPNIGSRPEWNYVKTIGCSIYGELPSDDARAIEGIFDRGIRFWKTPAHIGNYGYNNSPTSP